MRWPRYADGMWLDQETLNLEQDARREQVSRHALAAHRDPAWSDGTILSGLEVLLENGVLVVRPGYAVTRPGGLIRLPSEVTPPIGALPPGDHDLVLVAADCGLAVVAVRAAAGASPADTAGPGEVPLFRFTTDAAGLVTPVWQWPGPVAAAAVTHPDGRSRLTLGPADGHPGRALTVEIGGAAVTTVDFDGRAQMSARCRTAGALRAAGRLAFSRPAAPPDGPRPWRLYRVEAPGSDAQLRVELGEIRKGTKADSRRFVVVHDDAGPPRTTLAVDAGGTVTVSGDLVVTGVMSVPGGSPAGAALGRLARRSAQLYSEASLLRNSPSGTNLRIISPAATFSGPARSNLTVAFTVTVPFGLPALANVFVYLVVAAGDGRLHEAFEAQDVAIAPTGTLQVSRIVDVTPVPAGRLVQVDVVAVGRPATGAAGRSSDTWHTETPK